MTEHPLALVRRNALAALRPPPRVPLADWIEQNIFLPQTASATPGKMKLWAPQRGIVDAIEDPEIEEIVVSKSARVGLTALLGGVIGHAVSCAPQPILAVQPTTDDSRAFSVDVEQLFEASPNLRGLLTDDPTGRSTMMRRLYAGGSIEYLSSSSPRAFRRKLGKLCIADEIDAYPPTDEGQILDLLRMRSQTYRDRKHLFGGTPIFDFGPVTTLYEASDKRQFHICCPSCEEHFELLWEHVRWDDGKPETAHVVCPHHGCIITERDKPMAVERGKWVITAPDVKTRAGFRLNSLVSVHHNTRWSKLVEHFLSAKRAGPESLQSFVNLVLGEPWKSAEGDSVDQHELYQRREQFSLDNLDSRILWLSLGVDVQNDRLEAVVGGHDADGGFWILDHVVFHGNYDDDAVWRDLDGFLKTTWQHPLGGRIGLSAVAVDSGSGHHTKIVHDFTKPRSRVVSIKGVGQMTRPFWEKSNQNGLYIVGADSVKSALYLRTERRAGIYFSEALTPLFFEQFCSERRVVKYVKGKPEARFERILGKAAEGLDASVYAFACRAMITQNTDRRREELSSVGAPTPKAPAVIRSNFLNR